MQFLKTLAVVGAFGAAMAMSGGAYAACSDNPDGDYCRLAGENPATPIGPVWWPSQWGEGDEAGSTNHFKDPAIVLRALSVIKKGMTMEIGHDYHADMPLFGARKFSLRIPGTPTGGPYGPNAIMWNDEFLATEVGQVGTQFDGLGHIGVQVGGAGDKNEMRWYNGFTAAEMGNAYGLNHLGTEKLHPIIARGTLIDVSAIWGKDMVAGDTITMDHVNAALAAQGMSDFTIMPGDAIVFRTGWEQHWEDAATYNAGCPGIGMEVAQWIQAGNAGVTAGDTWPVDAVPNPDPDCVFCVHQYLQTANGIVNHENLKLSELAAAGIYRFAYFFNPTSIRGATGSMGAPVAMW